MKQAYLITAYKDADSLYELAEILAQNGYVYIHVDKKSRTITNKDIEKLNQIPRCQAIRMYNIKWGSFNHVRAIQKLMVMAMESHEVFYMHILTGEDFPLVSPEKLDEQFLTSDKIYMSYIGPEDLPETVEVRYRYYNWFPNCNVKNKVLWMIQHMTVEFQKKCGIFRKGIGEFTRVYKGLVYVSMPKEAAIDAMLCMVTHEKFWDDLYKCQVPEEFFFQTFFMNHENWSRHVVNRELRYMDWTKGDGSSPAYLTEADYDAIMASGCVFARKFHPEISKGLRERIKKSWKEPK